MQWASVGFGNTHRLESIDASIKIFFRGKMRQNSGLYEDFGTGPSGGNQFSRF
jgi:hypothetical protein